ncbi:MAG: hypothetical protein ACT4RN_18090 [Pseudonocardia sp.]
MTTTEGGAAPSAAAETAPATTPTTSEVPHDRRTLSWWAFGSANIAVVAVLSVLSWWLLVDPQWSPLASYPQPYTALLFWTIIAVVWLAFNCAWLGPQRLPQPARGLVGIGLTLGIGVAITSALAYGYGRLDDTFAAEREGGAGFTSGNLIVLFAFFFYVLVVLNWNHWPFAPRLSQPRVGLAELAVLIVPSVAAYGLLALPGLATWSDPASALFSLPTLIGWFYSVIISVVVTGLLLENWPWRAAGHPGLVAVLSLVGNVVVGTGIYYVLLATSQVLMGSANATALGDAVTLHAAELGVCWVFWMIAWANVFGNRPTTRGNAVNFLARIGITFGLGAATYLLYYFVVAGAVLHEPVLVGGMHGTALGFVDWAVLWMLWYVLFLGSYGLPAARSDEPAA